MEDFDACLENQKRKEDTSQRAPMMQVIATLASATFVPPHAAAVGSAATFLPHARRVLSSPQLFDDYRQDPAWQRDSILLLCYCGLEDLARNSATGYKEHIGFDFLQLNAELSCSFLVAFLWVGAALLTGVLGELRYDRRRVVLTWFLAAPVAAALRVAIFHPAFPVGTPEFAAFDAAATLALQLGLRSAEEQGYV